MNLRQRFLRYLLGVGLGTIFVIFVFGRRPSCKNYARDYMPNGRVLAEVRSLDFTYKTTALQHLESLNIDTADFREHVFYEGEIDFDASEPRKKPCGFYRMNSQFNEKGYSILFDKCKRKVEILSVVKQ